MQSETALWVTNNVLSQQRSGIIIFCHNRAVQHPELMNMIIANAKKTLDKGRGSPSKAERLPKGCRSSPELTSEKQGVCYMILALQLSKLSSAAYQLDTVYRGSALASGSPTS